ncbi:hypothetical protein IW152_002794 [Coemansia sp. BCRC 34962]|nr:hypothetical protein IW152_002794 [Coemansia sp. BCRC 34962]
MKHVKSSSAPKRARTSRECNTNHECTDDSCSCCGDGPVQLDDQVLSQPARTLLALALEEIESTGDRAVVIKLFETAIEKFGNENSLEHAWALLRLAEYAEFMEYAEKATYMVRGLNTAGEMEKGLCGLLEARAQVLSFCLEQSNWRDPVPDDGDSDDDVGEDTSKPIAGEQKLVDGLAQLVAAHSLLSAQPSAVPSFIDAYRGTLTFLFARREAHALSNRMLLILFDAAVTLVYEHEGWLATSSSEKAISSNTGIDSEDDTRKVAHQATLVWAMAAAECSVDSAAAEARLEPIVKYLASQPNDAECCKLYAQLLLVLCGCYEDEEKAMDAYDLATSKLAQAHKLSPNDPEIKSQLADMGQTFD